MLFFNSIPKQEDTFLKLSEINIDKSSAQPIYQQITDQITTLIQQGKLSPGEKLPTAQDFFLSMGLPEGL